jgi:dTDP-4-amino-4,6-dideoxygalactose transaminase
MPLGPDHKVCFANGTTALYAALVSLGVKRSLVAITPNVCPNVVIAIFASTNKPYFVEIESGRLGMSPQSLDRVIRKVSAVIAVHCFGTPCLIDELAARCRKHGVPLIEDCAQAQGATYKGKDVGSFGDVSIFSYGAGKILSLGGGGMAVTRRASMASRLRKIARRLSAGAPAEAAEELGSFFKFLYNHCYPDRLAPYRGAASRFFRSAAAGILAAPRPGLAQDIERAMQGLPSIVAARRSKSNAYARRLKGIPELEVCPVPEGAVPWRFNMRLEHSVRQRVLKALLSEGARVSSWYPDMRRFLPRASYASEEAPQAIKLDETILNLWVDESTTEGAIAGATTRLKQLLAR